MDIWECRPEQADGQENDERATRDNDQVGGNKENALAHDGADCSSVDRAAI